MAILAGNHPQRWRKNDELPIVRLYSHRMLASWLRKGRGVSEAKATPLSAVVNADLLIGQFY